MLILISLLILFANLYGRYWSHWLEYGVELNAFRSPYYKFGISFEPLQEGNDSIWRFTLGLIVFNIILSYGRTTSTKDDTTA